MDSSAPHPPADAAALCQECGAPLSDGQCLRCLLNLGTDAQADDRELPVPMAGRVLGDFVLNEEIARGGMGIVFRAQQRSLKREVALKLMLGGELASGAARRMFQTEALAAAALHHPNIVPVYDTGECDLQPFIAMRLVPGRRNIAHWAAEHRTAGAWRLIAEKAALVARAVAHAHDRGVLHRDLKPSNILWDAEAGPQVTDFGLAKLMNAAGDHVTLTAQMLGSPGYMAPEQTGEGGEEITTATDVYGLGAVLYELLSGQPPFTAKSAIETIRKVREESPPPLKSAPRDLATVCFKCLARSPGDRYVSGTALAEELERFARGEPVLAVPLPLVARLWRWTKRKPAIAALLSVSSLAVIGGFAGIFWQWRSAERARDNESSALLQAQATMHDLYTHSAQLETSRARAALWFSKAAFVSPTAEAREAHLSRCFAWRQTIHTVARILPSGVIEPKLSWNEEGSALLSVGHGTAEIWLPEENKCWLPLDPRPIRTAAWAGKGGTIAVVQGDFLSVLQFPSGKELAKVACDGTPVLALSADDRWIAVGGAQSFLWEPATGRKLALPPLAEPLQQVEFSSDGQLLMLRSAAELTVCDVSDPLAGLFPPISLYRPANAGFMGNDTLYFSMQRQEVLLADSRTGMVKERHIPASDSVISPQRASPDGRFLCTCQSMPMEKGKGFQPVRPIPAVVHDTIFTRDGQSMFLACADGLVRRYSLPEFKLEDEIGPHHSSASAVALSPDETHLAVYQTGGNLIRIWSLARGDPETGLTVNCGGNVRFSPDGRHVFPGGYNYEDSAFHETRVFSLQTGEPAGPVLTAAGGLIMDSVMTPDGNQLVLACATSEARDLITLGKRGGTGQLEFVDWRTGARSGEPLVLSSEPRSIAIHPTEPSMAVYCAGGELLEIELPSRHVHIRQPASRGHSATHWIPNGTCRYSPDGRFLTAWGLIDEPPLLWDRSTVGLVPLPVSDPHITHVDFHGNSICMVGWQANAYVWELPTLRQAGPPMKGTDGFFQGRFSPDGITLLTAGRAHAAHLRDWRTGQSQTRALVHKNEVYSTLFIPGTQAIVTGTVDGGIYFWDRTNGLPMRPPIQVPGTIVHLALSDDGRTLACGLMSGDGLRLFRLSELLPSSPLSQEAQLLLAEVDSGVEIAYGGIQPLTAEVWREKWSMFHNLYPAWDDYRPTGRKLSPSN